MISVRTASQVVGWWATASQERAVANARGAAVECSRARLERAEVEAFLHALTGGVGNLTAEVEAVSR